MREPDHVERVVDLPRGHHQGRGGFVKLRIGDEQHPQAIVQSEVAEFGLVRRGDDAGWQVWLFTAGE